ncbi:MAG TPA: alpha/beta hydrolase [Aquabacterium sp.]|uniref:alpha/beta fold hydrolase n=1 Tax=Aquabacterium sp. TaxID=1872578 RepID=UPI002E37FFA2|nr:alpha/beta hydrolase [Aquabacterium sp.]HEX5372654.1 alpha/beta hydrolase [Aquabacterium sp.]
MSWRLIPGSFTLTLARMQLKFTSLVAALMVSLSTLLAGCDDIGPPLTRAALSVERWHADLERKELVLPNGTRIAYLEGGRGDPLVLLHGFGTDKDNFTRVARWLTPHYRVIIPDLVGFGESSRLTGVDYRFAAQAQRVHDFTQALGLKQLSLGGNSMGGAIAMSYAAQHPKDVDSLWLLDPAGIAGAPHGELARRVLAGQPNPLIIEKEDDFPAMMNFAMSDPPYLPGPIMNVMARQRIANRALELVVFRQIALDSVNQAIRNLPTPTLIVWGEEDRVLSAGTVPLLKSLLPQAEAIVMPRIGHAPMIEHPRQAAEDYLRFRARIAAPGRSVALQ